MFAAGLVGLPRNRRLPQGIREPAIAPAADISEGKQRKAVDMTTYSHGRRTAIGISLVALLWLTGCGGPDNIGQVSGVVKLNGEPLSGARVEFTPKAGGRPSSGITDDSGTYRLSYTREVNGGEIGEHSVRITTFTSGDPDAEPPKAAVPEKVPAEYNASTKLEAKIEAGSNTVNFDLTASGPVAQPTVTADE